MARRYNLIDLVMENSVNQDNRPAALSEWRIAGADEDPEMESSRICGKENIKYLFAIENVLNGRNLFPVGSKCIKLFERSDWNQYVDSMGGMFKLYRAVRDGARIELSTQYFSRKLLEELYNRGAFKPTKYNHGDGQYDYWFLLKMFNKRGGISVAQQSKIRAIIVTSIRPYLQQHLKDERGVFASHDNS